MLSDPSTLYFEDWITTISDFSNITIHTLSTMPNRRLTRKTIKGKDGVHPGSRKGQLSTVGDCGTS
jgi:hypothetical protein